MIAYDQHPKLTERERQILIHLATGDSDIDVASKNFISVSTVRTHVRSLREKFCARSRTEVVIQALLFGTISLQEIHQNY